MVLIMVVLIVYYVLVNMLNVLDYYWFLIVIYIGGGILQNIWLMKGYFDNVLYDLDELVKLDGVGNFKIFWLIVLLLVKLMIVV